MLVGQQIGPFEVEREIGSGAMGTVYKAKFRKDDAVVPIALKMISFGLLGNEGAMARFEREAAILKQLKHPHIVRLYATGKWKKTPFIAMEFVDGDSLDKKLALKGKLSWEEAADVCKQLCRALQHAHQKGIIHRDLKPSNLMVTRDGVMKLTDFGIAKDQDVTALTGQNSTIGTASYMSPEQCRGERNLTAKSDLYSLGVVMYELVTGRKPFQAETTIEMFLKHVNEAPVRPRKLAPDLPVWIDNLIMFLLEKDKDHRPLDADTVEAMLAAAEEKMLAQQSLGAEVANARRADRQVGEAPVGNEEKEVARALRSGGRKKKRRKSGKWYAKSWVKAVPVVAALAAVLAVGAYLVWQNVKPEGIEPAYKRVAEADNPEAKLKAAEAFLSAHGRDPDPRVADVLAIYREHKARAAEQILSRWVGKKGRPDVFDEETFRLAMKAVDAERAGNLKEAADLWVAVRDKPVEVDAGKFPDETETAKGMLKWVGEKRAKEASQTAPELLVKLTRQVEDDRALEVERTYETGSVEGQVVRALRLDKIGDKPKAKAVWDALTSQTEKELDQHVWYLIAAQQAAQIAADPAKDDPKAVRLTRLTELIDRLEKEAEPVRGDPEARVARRAIRVECRDVVQLYDDDPTEPVKAIVARAKKLTESLPK